MSTSTAGLREPTAIQEEIADLREYLDGLPEELRASGAFDSYEHRRVELNRELVASLLYNSYVVPHESTAPSPEQVYPMIDSRLASLEQKHKTTANHLAAVTRVVQYALLGGTACTLVSAIISLHAAFPVTLSAISAVLAAILTFRGYSDRALKEERLADCFKALRIETGNILTTAGDISMEPRYYEHSAKTIESIIQDISTQHHSP